MNYEITFSPTGGTKRVTDLLVNHFEGEMKEVSLLPREADYAAFVFGEEDVCVIAVPSFGGRAPITAIHRIEEMKGNGARAVLVCAYGNRAYEDTLLELKDAAVKAGFRPVAAVSAVAEHSIMRQFAAGRPDEEDVKQLNEFGKAIGEKLASMESLPEVSVPGNHPYKKYGGVPFKPAANKECNECGVCAKECPVGAIDPSNLRKTNGEACISCMRCIEVCPQKARRLNSVVLKMAAGKMKKMFEERKENELF